MLDEKKIRQIQIILHTDNLLWKLVKSYKKQVCLELIFVQESTPSLPLISKLIADFIAEVKLKGLDIFAYGIQVKTEFGFY